MPLSSPHFHAIRRVICDFHLFRRLFSTDFLPGHCLNPHVQNARRWTPSRLPWLNFRKSIGLRTLSRDLISSVSQSSVLRPNKKRMELLRRPRTRTNATQCRFECLAASHFSFQNENIITNHISVVLNDYLLLLLIL